MWRYIKRAIAHALAELVIRFGIWFAKTFGPALVAMSLLTAGVLCLRHYLMERWPHPEAYAVIGHVLSVLPAVVVLVLTAVLFAASVLAEPDPRSRPTVLDYGLDNRTQDDAPDADILQFPTTEDMETVSHGDPAE